MIKDVFQAYLNRLTDLSTKNRGIYLPKLVVTQMVDLKDFEFLQEENAFAYIQDLLGRKKQFPLLEVSDARDKKVNRLSSRLQRLGQQVKLAEEETGEKTLFVAWPFVEGKLLNGQIIRAPLIFFPVRLLRDENNWYLKKKPGDHPFINKSFMLAYSHSLGKPFNKEWIENALEDFSKDPTQFRTDLYHYLKKELTLNFTQELFEDKVDEFTETERVNSERDWKEGILQLKPFAILGQFPQKSSFLINDYETLLDRHQEQGLESLFENWFEVKAEESKSSSDVLLNTFPVDASQEEVLQSVKSGESCVVEGPPGTGKSQLICNLVTDFTSRGKKVLVVSQKRAALDVVKERLGLQGFSAFVALVHDFRADRNALFKQLASQIQSLESYKELNRSLDAIQLERNFSKTVSTIQSHAEFLEEYRQALYNTEECGAPIKELYVNSALNDEHLDMTQFYKNYRWDMLDEFCRDFREYSVYYKKYEQADSFWLHRVDFGAFTPKAIHRFKETLTEIGDLKETAEEILGELLGQDFEFPLVYQAYEHRERIVELQQWLHQEENFVVLKELMAYKKNEIDLLWLENKGEIVKKLLSDDGIEWTIPDGEVEKAFEKVIRILEIKDSWWKSLALIWNRKEFGEVGIMLENNDLEKNKEGLLHLKNRLENRLNLNHQYTLLDRKPWIHLPKKPFDFAEFNHCFHVLMEAVKARLVLDDLGMLAAFLIRSKTNYEQFQMIVQELIGINNLIPFKIQNWQNYLSQVQIKHLLTSPDNKKLMAVKESLVQDFNEIVALDRIKKRVRGVDLEVMKKHIDSYPEKTFDRVWDIFLAGLKLSWIEHIEKKYTVLQQVSVAKVKHVLEELSFAVDEKISLSRYITELRLREKTFQNLQYNRLNNLVTYRELTHQVTKKRRVWTVKKLVEHFQEEIFRLIPCWMASPETVSALFPLDDYFDLVIFDESSQCFAEQGVPAMLRGKQVVIAGDSQQLQPFDLYKVRLDEEGEGMALEAESLLALASGYFKKYSLEGHYRSKSLSLIHFSNQHFYNNTLNMLPEMEGLNHSRNVFERVKVEGVWENQMNQVEAEEVLDQLKNHVRATPNLSFGVITFNYFQMMLIVDLVSQERSLFNSNIKVRNIENVQGDEFDIVIFSVGYAPNKSGKFTANFGLLSKSGGGNRLNVAVTRSRRKIILVTSLNSRDFKIKQLANPGVKLLKEYLQYVEDISEGNPVNIEKEEGKGFASHWNLKDKLVGKFGNHEVRDSSQSKVMDLELLIQGKYQGAILTDDNRLFSAKSAKEAFVYHPKLLKEKGWNVVQVFSRQHWIDPEDLLETKIKSINENKIN
ncbi:AAA domain-containing protein [Echinicola jeungdonensis]|uniref:AAA domain-containing protein n=1 Tax=Echinicola jeungdonensis TaxID=709343 RepID=A0ABV5J819_9BACT|nr:AAA domain-containing protein [Echinicola jeungdonensis]MDN3669860.1 AAA domain-containing protein [Echinicola jeungdonensis]